MLYYIILYYIILYYTILYIYIVCIYIYILLTRLVVANPNQPPSEAPPTIMIRIITLIRITIKSSQYPSAHQKPPRHPNAESFHRAPGHHDLLWELLCKASSRRSPGVNSRSGFRVLGLVRVWSFCVWGFKSCRVQLQGWFGFWVKLACVWGWLWLGAAATLLLQVGLVSAGVWVSGLTSAVWTKETIVGVTITAQCWAHDTCAFCAPKPRPESQILNLGLNMRILETGSSDLGHRVLRV